MNMFLIKKMLPFSAVSLLLSSCAITASPDLVCYQKQCIDVEIVFRQEDRMKGLQDREYMAEDKGMLFIFHEMSKHSFWMKKTKISLDMIWMDAEKYIVHIEENVQPCKKNPCPVYEPAKEALYVLEVNAGVSGKMGLKVGEKMDFRIRDYLKDL